MGSGAHVKRRRYRGVPVLLAGAGVVLLGLAAALVIRVVSFYAHSSAVGSGLVAKEKAVIARERMAISEPAAVTTRHPGRSNVATTVSCPVPHPSAGRPAALLEVPAIGLDAPVLQGDGDGVLAVAVGHDPASSWQAGPGTVVLDAHDVTWFHHLPRLHPGDIIKVVDPCDTVRYRVEAARVEPAGTPVVNRPGHLVLVTCYPLDALFYTDQRYVLTATQVGGPIDSAAQLSGAQRRVTVPGSGAPSAWSGVDTLAANPTPLGSLQVNGHPSAAWSESPAPLEAAAAVQDAFFASLREGEESTATWSGLHPGLLPTQAVTNLAGTQVVGNIAAMQTILDVEGATVRSATVTDGVGLSDGVELDLKGTFDVSGSRTGSPGSFRLISWAAG